MMTNVHSENRIKFVERFVAEAKIMLMMKHERVGKFVE
jgi:hypothetical protein